VPRAIEIKLKAVLLPFCAIVEKIQVGGVAWAAGRRTHMRNW